ncbi:CBP80/20-dependent translation initiation factor-like isoform X2 [Pomacea canaliculata]|nr:CBP80/20-dependent translation initiation factor-like isoform X2 [Pomacea canaliculata]
MRSTAALAELETLISQILYDISDDDLQHIERLSNAAASSEDLHTIAKFIYIQCQKNREFAKVGAIICDRLANIEREGMRFRNCILSLVQTDYRGREALRRESSSQFMALVSFLSQLLTTMRLANGEVMQPLVQPIYDCFDLILSQDEMDADECECLSLQLQSIGRELQDSGEDQMQALMDNIRSKIIQEKTKANIRCVLMEVLECYVRRWQNAPNDVTRFYCDSMADILAGMVI